MGVTYQDALSTFRHIDTWKQGVSKFALLNTFKYLNCDPSACTAKIVQRTELQPLGPLPGYNLGPPTVAIRPQTTFHASQ